MKRSQTIAAVLYAIICLVILSVPVNAIIETKETVDTNNILSNAATSSGQCGDNLYWTESNFVLEITGYGEMWNYNEKTNKSPWSKNVDSIILNEGITHIGDYAFSNQQDWMGPLDFPDGLISIGEGAFSKCYQLHGDLVFPNTLKTIGDKAFYDCERLDGILLIPNSVTHIGSKAFYDCRKIVGDLVIPSTITDISESCFYRCESLNGFLSISENVKTIGDWAFYGCKALQGELTLPKQLTVLGSYAFCGCYKLTGHLDFPDNLNQINDGTFSYCESLTGDLIIPEHIHSLGTQSFSYCSGLNGNLIIESNLKYIPEECFAYCKGLTGSLILPESLIRICRSAFSNCTGFSGDLIIPDSVTVLEAGCFFYCTGLNGKVEMPTHLVSIEDSVFERCSGITTVEGFGSSLKKIGCGVFDRCAELSGSLTIPHSVFTIGSNIINGCTNLNKVIFEGPAPIMYSYDETLNMFSTTEINTVVSFLSKYSDSYIEDDDHIDLAEKTWWGLRWEIEQNHEVTILTSGACGDNLNWCLYSDGDLYIYGAGDMYDYEYGSTPWFSYAEEISNISFSNQITSIGNNAFCDSIGLCNELSLPGELVSIGDHAFSDCIYLPGNIVLPDKLSSIGDYAFCGCKSLNGKIYWGLGLCDLFQIGNKAFYGCEGLSGTCTNSLYTLENNFDMPDYNQIYIGDEAFGECKNLVGVVILPQRLRGFGISPFIGCSSITAFDTQYCESYRVYNGVVYSSDLQTLHECPGGVLEFPVLYPTVKVIADKAFMGCTYMTGLLTLDYITDIGDYAFYDCRNLYERILVRHTISNIGDDAFKGCALINRIIFEENAPSILGESIFDDTDEDFIVICRQEYAHTFLESDLYNEQDMTWNGYKLDVVEGRNKIAYDGPCGDNTWWTLYDDGDLYFSGEGDMWDYKYENNVNSAPWNSVAVKPDRVIFENGITRIGSNILRSTNCIAGDIVIPDSVRVIGEFAFCNCGNGLEYLHLNNSLVEIEDCAFQQNYFLGSLLIPDSVEMIGTSAFNTSGFPEGIVIGNGISNIGTAVFAFSEFETTLNLPSNITSIGQAAFYDCKNLCGELNVPENVSSIGIEAFMNCENLSNTITFNGNIDKINHRAFANCKKIDSVYFKGNAPTMGTDVFSGCNNNLTIYCDSLYSYSFLNNDMYDVSSNTWYGYPLVIQKQIGQIIQSGICGENSTWSLYSSGELEILGTGDMFDYSYDELPPWYEFKDNIFELVLNEGITSIGDWAFYGCDKLTGELVIPFSITTIGINAFYNCTGLSGHLNLPESIIEIREGAFSSCSGFDGDLIIPGGMTIISDGVFYGCDGFNGTLVLPTGLTMICNNSFFGCNGLTGNLSLPNSLTKIGSGAFQGCCGFTGNLNIPESVTELGTSSFSSCRGFTGNLVIPDFISDIPYRAFSNCTGFTSLELSDNVIAIGDYAFYGCSGISGNLILTHNITDIGKFAFSNCTQISDILIIPDSVSNIGMRAFYGCSQITSALFEGEMPWNTIGTNTFYGCQDGFTVYCYSSHQDSFLSSSYYDSSTNTWYGYPFVIIDDEVEETFPEGLQLNSKSISLGSNLGVNFKMTVPEEYVDSSYMTFTGHGRTTTIQTSNLTPDEKGQYVFTCYVTSIEMAEQIQAVFTYGENQASMTYSVAGYINAYEEVSGSYPEETTALVHALADYGHHAQTFLSKYRSWSIGKDYAEMEVFTPSYTAEELEAVRAEVANYALSYSTNADISAVNISLNLESET